MATYTRGKQSGGNRNFGKSRFGNDRPDMHKATCDDCGKICEVPFRPTGGKPVFCRDCFKNHNDGGDSSRSENRGFGRIQSEERQMYDAVCSRCGADCKIPFRPTQGREVLCSRCFDTKSSTDTRRNDRRPFDRPHFPREDRPRTGGNEQNYAAQFETLNAKMDMILALLKPQQTEVEPLESALNENVIEEIVEEVEEAKEQQAVEKKPTKSKTTAKKSPKKTSTSKKK